MRSAECSALEREGARERERLREMKVLRFQQSLARREAFSVLERDRGGGGEGGGDFIGRNPRVMSTTRRGPPLGHRPSVLALFAMLPLSPEACPLPSVNGSWEE